MGWRLGLNRYAMRQTRAEPIRADAPPAYI